MRAPPLKDIFKPADLALLEKFVLDALYCPNPQKKDRAIENLRATQIMYSMRDKKYYIKPKGEPVIPLDRPQPGHIISEVYHTEEGVMIRLTTGDKPLMLCPTPKRYGQKIIPKKVDSVRLS